MTDSHPPAPLELLRRPILARVMVSTLFRYLMNWVEPLATGWVALELTDSAFGVAFTGFARVLPLLLFGLFTGLVADRFDRRRILIVVQVTSAALAIPLALLYAAGQLQYWHLIAASLGFGILNVADTPARRALASALVEREAVPSVAVMDVTTSNAMRFFSPLLGGLLLDRLGPAACYALFAAASVASAGFVVGLVTPARGGPRVAGGVREALEGIRQLPAAPAALGVVIITVGMNVFNFSGRQLFPVFARDILGTGPFGYGLLEAIYGLGSLFSALAMALRGAPQRMGLAFVLGSTASSLCFIGFAMSRSFSLSLGLAFMMGLVGSFFGVMQYSIPVTSVVDAMRGRILGTVMLAIGTSPLGHLFLGLLANQAGTPFAVGLFNAFAVVWITATVLLVPGLVRFTRGTSVPASPATTGRGRSSV